MNTLKFFPPDESNHLIQPEEFYNFQPSSPAIYLVSDFRQHKPHMIDSHLKASQALEMMKVEDVKLKIAVDINKEFVGVLDRNHLSSENMLLTQNQLGIKHSELLVSDLMRPKAKIQAVDINQLSDVTIANLISAMKFAHQEYLLVIDAPVHHIRGILSAQEISQRLKQPIAIEKALTFADIFTAVHVD